MMAPGKAFYVKDVYVIYVQYMYIDLPLPSYVT